MWLGTLEYAEKKMQEEQKTKQVFLGIDYEGHQNMQRKKCRMSRKQSNYFWGLIIKDIRILLRGTWVAQLVERLTSAQVMISPLISLSPTSGSVLTPQSLEPASDSVSFSLCPSLARPVCVSLKNKHLKTTTTKKNFV